MYLPTATQTYYFIDKDGSVIYSTLREDFSGTDLFVGEFKEHRIANMFKIALEDVGFEDYLLE